MLRQHNRNKHDYFAVKQAYRFKIIEAPNCPRGNDNQTAEHILL